jgi:hypothetical protein
MTQRVTVTAMHQRVTVTKMTQRVTVAKMAKAADSDGSENGEDYGVSGECQLRTKHE